MYQISPLHFELENKNISREGTQLSPDHPHWGGHSLHTNPNRPPDTSTLAALSGNEFLMFLLHYMVVF